MKVLDTTFLIDLIRGKPETKEYLMSVSPTIFFTTQINIYEVAVGMFMRKMSPSKFLQVQELFENIRVLSLDDKGIIKSAEICADLLKRGQVIEDGDCLTAGIALSKGVAAIVTRNTEHFRRIKGIKVETY